MRIIGAEPAGDSVHEVTGPVEEEHPELPHWNDAPTGQVPAVLDRSNGEEPLVAPPTWREEETDWEAQEEVFEPSMLSEDLPAVGALLGEQAEEGDVEHQPWHFESDDTLVIPPEPGLEHEPAHAASDSGADLLHEPYEHVRADAYEPEAEPELRAGRGGAAAGRLVGDRHGVSGCGLEAEPAASRRSRRHACRAPPAPWPTCARAT